MSARTVSLVGGNTSVQRTLTLAPDGTFRWDGISSVGGDGYRVGGETAASGTWTATTNSLTLRARDGTVTRGIAFPFDDPATAAYPDRLYFGGLMYKRQ